MLATALGAVLAAVSQLTDVPVVVGPFPPAAPPVAVLAAPVPTVAEEIDAALAEIEQPQLPWTPGELPLLGAPDIGILSSIAVGRPNRGLLLNAAQLRPGPGYQIVEPERAWGTTETIAALRVVLFRLYREDPMAPELYVGQLSRKTGGWLKRHKSHQSGRDVDLGLPYRDGSHWYLKATRENLDVERTLQLVRLLLQTERIEYIFADRSIIAMLQEQAEALGLDEAERAQLFYDRAHAPEGALRHAWGHSTHLHVRFYSPLAEARGQQLYPQLTRLGLVPRARYY